MTDQTETGKAITVTQRATLALGLKERETELKELAERSKSITAITNADSYQQCHAARMALKNERVDIQKRGKEARDDANAFSKAVIAEERRLVGIISGEEERLQKLQKDHDDAIEAERQRKIEAEERRVEGIQTLIAAIRDSIEPLAWDTPSRDIAIVIDRIAATDVDEGFDEFTQQAQDAKDATLARLREMHAAAEAREADEARRKEEQKELERLRAAEHRRREIRGRIDGIREVAQLAARLVDSSERFAEVIAETEGIEIDASFEEFTEEAEAAKASTLAKLRALYNIAVKREKAEAARQAELERREAEVKAEQERQERREKVAEAIAVLQALPTKGYEMTAAELTRLLARAEAFEIPMTVDDGDLLTKGTDAKREAIGAIKAMLKGRQEYEAEKAEQEHQRKEREQAEKAEDERKEAAERAAKEAEYPGDDALIAALVDYYAVTDEVARKWLRQYGKKARAAA